MAYALFLTYCRTTAPAGDLADWFHQDVAPSLRACSDDIVIDMFVPDPDGMDVLHFDDAEQPDLMIQFTGRSPAQLSAVPAQAGLVEAVPWTGSKEETKITAGMFEIIETPVGDNAGPLPRTAEMSFMVRYFGPSENDEAFAAHYAASHPPIMARFPGIRNVFCYVPVAWENPGFHPSPVIVGNEVVFDNVAALNAALRSDVLAELRADSKGFAPFAYNTHHAMRRRTVS